ncbi:Hypothetical predicted protein [Podarcis lilfordi]|uniref:Uncharacterized protein n=1 Tax=Podarcis lilfordi TaxID=74358 RepID=A0AA35LBD1_9SAUR|nr:Hypothetical predicted protein [Podarcis lilfordi]
MDLGSVASSALHLQEKPGLLGLQALLVGCQLTLLTSSGQAPPKWEKTSSQGGRLGITKLGGTSSVKESNHLHHYCHLTPLGPLPAGLFATCCLHIADQAFISFNMKHGTVLWR